MNNLDENIKKVKNFINHLRFEEPAQYSLQEWFLAIESLLASAEASKDNIITTEQFNQMKWEKEHAEMRFVELNKLWHKVINELLGEDYYNDGCDWKSCDEFSAEDLIRKYKKRKWQFWKKI